MMKQIHLHMQSIPIYTPAGHSLFAAGNFNNWKTGDEHFRFKKNADGTFSLRFETDLSVIEFRCNRGNWQLAEGDEYAKPNPVRSVLLSGDKNIIPVHISSWIDFADEHLQHTASENVLVIAHDFLSRN
ncbi:MAG: hypothetical protein HC867_05050 [Bacteroidia bacterium]|nr:hypothetical protein [Bacteroidia bacterium]